LDTPSYGDIKGETESAGVQTALKKKFCKKKLTVNADYIKNMKELFTT